jgi:hypothetical protein
MNRSQPTGCGSSPAPPGAICRGSVVSLERARGNGASADRSPTGPGVRPVGMNRVSPQIVIWTCDALQSSTFRTQGERLFQGPVHIGIGQIDCERVAKCPNALIDDPISQEAHPASPVVSAEGASPASQHSFQFRRSLAPRAKPPRGGRTTRSRQPNSSRPPHRMRCLPP